jgi:RNA polymerase sigma factor (sigma-70 family)
MNDDTALLRRYAEEGHEPAFTELVRRHVDLVYGAALRRTGGDAHRAAEVAQHVFTTLARDARKLAHHPQLAAWLHTATRNAALNLMISEQRRQARETAAFALESVGGGGATGPAWEQLQPLLDAAIDELPETDRAAVVLRFLERRPFAEIGAALRVSEDAARVRTDRALDKLRVILGRRGVTSTGAALGAVMAGQSLVAAPAGLAASLALGSLAAAGVGASATTLFSIMSTKLITAAALGALIAFSAGTYFGMRREAAPVEAPVVVAPSREATHHAQTIAALRQDNQQLAAELTAAQTEVARLRAIKAAAAKNPTIGMPLYEQQRDTLSNLRRIDAARAEFRSKNGRPAESILELVSVGRYIKIVRTVGGEDYSALSMEPGQPLTVTAPDGVSVTYDPSGAKTTPVEIPPAVAQELKVRAHEQKVDATMLKAVEAYRAANGGFYPPTEAAILAYFATPQEGADFVEFMESRKKPKKP